MSHKTSSAVVRLKERNRITAAIAKKVGKPSKAKLKALERRRARHLLAP